MNITYNEVNNILKTLPIGYYIGRKVEVTLNTSSSTSFYVPIEDRIEVSFNQLTSATSKISDDEDAETIVRSLLYHEVSHAFLTPKHLKITNVMNIFEDERIETVLKSYYMNTDFKRLVKLINSEDEPTDALQFFYHIVRFRKGPKQFTDKVQELILEFKNLNRNTKAADYWSKSAVLEYENAVRKFYEEVEEYWNRHHDELTSEKEISEESETNDELTIQQSNNEDNIEESETFEKSEESEESEVLSSEEIKKLFENPFSGSDFNEKINQILRKIKTFESRNGSAIHSYSGVFNPRSTGREDYRFFLQENRLGSAKAFSKFHINLFIDNSGSFFMSDPIINMLLKSLRDFEKSNPNFTFDLVTINMDIVVRDHSNLEFHSWGGNRLNDEIYDVYKRLQRSDSRNFNIVLFDGDAVSDSYSNMRKHASNFKAFDHNNCIIITDSANEWILKRYIKAAKTKIITSGYANELQNEILKALSSIV